MEKEFPPTFLNIMAHLPVHLVEQLLFCGPVHCMWMYPTERYMKTLKDCIRAYAHPEGSIAKGYRQSDTLGFCTEYMRHYKATTHRVWDPNEDAMMKDEILRRNKHTMRRCPTRCDLRACYQPKVTTFDFVLVRVIALKPTPALNIIRLDKYKARVLKNTARLMLVASPYYPLATI